MLSDDVTERNNLEPQLNISEGLYCPLIEFGIRGEPPHVRIRVK